MDIFKNAKRVVVKVGSSTLTHENGHINIRRLEGLVKVLADIRNSGKELVIVSSGAMSVGFGKLGLPCRPSDMPGKQAVSAVGQCELMYLYDKYFSEYNHTVAQVLLTKDIVDSPERKQNCINTFERLLSLNAVPIVNENDTVSVEEIEFGDNDTLSALVAVLVRADALVLVSDVDGLYDRDPKDPAARLLPEVREITPEIEALAGGAGSRVGTGGMVTKICAAKIATKNGIDMAIVNGRDPRVLYDLFDGKPAGTRFLKVT